MSQSLDTPTQGCSGGPVDWSSLVEGETVVLKQGGHTLRRGVVSRVLADGAFILLRMEPNSSWLFLNFSDGYTIHRFARPPGINESGHA